MAALKLINHSLNPETRIALGVLHIKSSLFYYLHTWLIFRSPEFKFLFNLNLLICLKFMLYMYFCNPNIHKLNKDWGSNNCNLGVVKTQILDFCFQATYTAFSAFNRFAWRFYRLFWWSNKLDGFYSCAANNTFPSNSFKSRKWLWWFISWSW